MNKAINDLVLRDLMKFLMFERLGDLLHSKKEFRDRIPEDIVKTMQFAGVLRFHGLLPKDQVEMWLSASFAKYRSSDAGKAMVALKGVDHGDNAFKKALKDIEDMIEGSRLAYLDALNEHGIVAHEQPTIKLDLTQAKEVLAKAAKDA